MYQDKLYDMLNIIHDKHLDINFHISKQELASYLNQLLNEHPINNEYDFYYYSNVVIKKIFDCFDSHTKLGWKSSPLLPVRFQCIDDQVYILKADKEYQDLLYGKLLSINHVPIQTIMDEIEKMTPYSTKEFLNTQIETSLYHVNKLKSLPSMDSSCTDFLFCVENHGIKSHKIIKEGRNHFPRENYQIKIYDDIMILTYSKCSEDYPNQMLDFVQEIKKQADFYQISKFIVDIRGNQGGNSNLIKPLVSFLEDKEVVTLVDSYVFSAGRFAAVDLYNIGSPLIGTQIGTSLNSFGNISITDMDPFHLAVSNRYFYFTNENNRLIEHLIFDQKSFLEFKNNLENKKYFTPSFLPITSYVHTTIEDYEACCDTFIEKGKEILDKKEKVIISK